MNLPFICVSPQCPSHSYWPVMNDELSTLLDEVIERYSVDTERVYLTGLSMGGYGTWHMSMLYPDKFAAIAPICGGGNPRLTYLIKDIPIWTFHGAKDTTVPIKETEDMVNALKDIGSSVKYTVYPEAKHDSWTETYNNPELYEWFLSHRKNVK
jgi:predicted peptidase